jgi:cellobiose dehydrogenase (acceptor)
MGTDGVKRYVQGSVRPGAGSVSTSAPYNASTIFSVSVYLAQGLTSRGRLGLTNNLGIRATVTPYFTDPVDKAVLVQALQDVVDAAKNGE